MIKFLKKLFHTHIWVYSSWYINNQTTINRRCLTCGLKQEKMENSKIYVTI